MKKYIDKTALMKTVHTGMNIIEVMQAIIDEPAADVVEVRHGRWERVDYGNGLYNYHCSSCRHIPRENIRSNYCPNCGCAMEETE